jgi:hypothetical protein
VSAGGRSSPSRPGSLFLQMSEVTVSLEQQLDEIGTQLAWVRDYL